MKYEKYTAEDFFNDENFRKWILDNDPRLNYFWEKWTLQNPAKRQELELARKLVLSLKFKEEKITQDQKRNIWQQIIREKQLIEKSNRSKKVRPIDPDKNLAYRNISVKTYVYKGAAVLLILLVAWFLLLQNTKPESEIIEAQVVKKENPAGQKSKIFLPDGSVVYLNASSSVTYKEEFEPHRRQILLSGEAFFEVAKDSLRPFIVSAKSVETRALGTEFSIAAYPEQDEIMVSLLEGKVEVKNKKGAMLTLQEREAARYDLLSRRLDKTDFDLARSILWKDGILYFNKADLKAVIAKLERWYGVEFAIVGSYDYPQAINGRFENESLDNVLQSISFSSEFEYEINGKNVTVKF